MRHSREYLSEGGLLQASEKGSGAAAHAVKSYAAWRGLDYREHRDFGDIILALRTQTQNHDIRSWASSAEQLHRNFYDDNHNSSEIELCLDEVKLLVNLIEQVIGLAGSKC